MANVLFIGVIILSLFAGHYYHNDLLINSAVILVSLYVFIVFVLFGCWIFFDARSNLDKLGSVGRDKLLIIAAGNGNSINFMMLGLVLMLTMCGMMFAAVMVVVCAFMIFWIQDDVRGYLNNGENHE
jgi:hypothetical protein